MHGGRAVVGAVLAALARIPGCRPAAAGEFTRRAYEGGRLDLTQVEGLRDLIDADTESQRRAALRVARVGWAYFPCLPLLNIICSVQGDARVQYHALREEVVACLALVEALIDFGEGEDLEEGVFAQGN